MLQLLPMICPSCRGETYDGQIMICEECFNAARQNYNNLRMAYDVLLAKTIPDGDPGR